MVLSSVGGTLSIASGLLLMVLAVNGAFFPEDPSYRDSEGGTPPLIGIIVLFFGMFVMGVWFSLKGLKTLHEGVFSRTTMIIDRQSNRFVHSRRVLLEKLEDTIIQLDTIAFIGVEEYIFRNWYSEVGYVEDRRSGLWFSIEKGTPYPLGTGSPEKVKRAAETIHQFAGIPVRSWNVRESPPSDYFSPPDDTKSSS